MALLNIAAMTADKKVNGVVFEIDERAAKSLLEIFNHCAGLMGHEAMANVRRALEEIADVKMVTPETAALLVAGDSEDTVQPSTLDNSHAVDAQGTQGADGLQGVAPTGPAEPAPEPQGANGPAQEPETPVEPAPATPIQPVQRRKR